VTSEIVQLNLDDPGSLRVRREIIDLLCFYKTGLGRLREIAAKMRFVIETYCTFTYPGFFASHDTLSSIIEKIRSTGEKHPACALLDELDEIHAYSQDYFRGDDSAVGAEEALDINELKDFVWRTLKIVRADSEPASESTCTLNH
jgi:hypothetical protein